MKLIKGIVEDLDLGHLMASVVVRSGKRIISVVIPRGEAIAAGLQENREVFCLIQNKDIILFRDAKEYLGRMLKKNPNMHFDLGM